MASAPQEAGASARAFPHHQVPAPAPRALCSQGCDHPWIGLRGHHLALCLPRTHPVCPEVEQRGPHPRAGGLQGPRLGLGQGSRWCRLLAHKDCCMFGRTLPSCDWRAPRPHSPLVNPSLWMRKTGERLFLLGSDSQWFWPQWPLEGGPAVSPATTPAVSVVRASSPSSLRTWPVEGLRRKPQGHPPS